MTPEQLREIIQLDEKATDGPWLASEADKYGQYFVWAPCGVTDYDTYDDDRPTNCVAKPPHENLLVAKNDMTLIAKYRTAAPEMARILLRIFEQRKLCRSDGEDMATLGLLAIIEAAMKVVDYDKEVKKCGSTED